MRRYDRITGKRFDMNHPVWQEHNKTKKGVVSKQLTKVRIVELTKAGLVNLVPSVTEIAKVADGFGAFNAGMYWGSDMTIQAFTELRDEKLLLALDGAEGAIKTRARAIMHKPRDIGSDLHDAFDRIHTGKLGIDAATDDQKAFYQVCLDKLGELDLLKDPFQTEVMFAGDRYGGTPDFDSSLDKGVDWKTVKDWRKPKPSEYLQLGAYGHALGWDEAWICYYHQTEHLMRDVHMDKDTLTRAYEAFTTVLDFYEQLTYLLP